MAQNPLAAAAATHPELEIWWDSSPLILDGWKSEVAARTAGTPEDARSRERLSGVWSAVVGCTTNPPLTLQVVERDPGTWGKATDALIRRSANPTDAEVFWSLYADVVRAGAEALLPVFGASAQRRGYISGQVDPRVLTDTATMVSQGIFLHGLSPNIMIKMPGTREGILGIALLTALGIPTNATLVFTLSQMLAVAEAAKSGLALARANGTDLSAWRSVCTMMLGRFEDCDAFDRDAAVAGVEITPSLRRWAGIAITNRAVELYRDRGYETKVLAASMRVGPEVDGRARIWHIEKLLGQPIVLTIFPNIIEAWLEHYDGETLPTTPGVVPEDALQSLLRLPYFRDAYGEQQDAASFVDHPAVVVTAEAFAEATDKLQAWVKGRIQRAGS